MCEKNNDVATEETVMCDLCHGEFSPDDLTETNDGMICLTCLDEHYMTCDDCGALIHEDDLYRVYDEQGNEVWVCSSCLDNYTQCEDCGEYYPTRTMTDKVKSLLRLSSSSNENEAREAMAYLTENIKLRR